MTKKAQNFSMFAGDTKDIVVNMGRDLITGASIKWGLKSDVLGSTLISKTSSNGITSTDNSFTIRLSSADTIALKGQYYHEAEVTDVAGNISTVMVGKVTIEASGV